MPKFKPFEKVPVWSSNEEEILSFWDEKKVFDQICQRQGIHFSFYEGPPTANGKPGIHHVLTRTVKDTILRYKTMQGYAITRKAGWDCHGLPVEVEVEKTLGLKGGKKGVEDFGVRLFNQKCRESVSRYIEDWESLTKRMGYWVDLQNAYRTDDLSYVEACWGVLQRLWEKGLLEQDFKTTKHCPRCETALADAEVNQGMKEEVEDPSVLVRFLLTQPLVGRTTALLAWTTTPWSLPANVAVAVHPDAEYVIVSVNGENLLVQRQAAPKVGGEVVASFVGRELVGLMYESLYHDRLPSGYVPRVVADEMVTIGEGTGVVHIAPAYGDLEVGRRYDLPVVFSVGPDGKMLDGVLGAGLFFKKADSVVLLDLQNRGALFSQEKIKHSYPFCWRCNTPLLNLAKIGWYVKTTKVKEKLVAENQKIQWIPEHLKEGRFGNWLHNNVDWALSRERYWGTPFPLWVCGTCERKEMVGSIAQLSALLGRDARKDVGFDLHRPYVDELEYPCGAPECMGVMKRVREVVDCWFDSGAMPYASGEGVQFPADFISEGIDQTRGWFYTLHALGVMLRDQVAFRTCVVLGHVVDEHGQKMAKKLGNTVDPWEVFKRSGADAVRYYLCSGSPLDQPKKFSQQLVTLSAQRVLLPFWHCCNFLATYGKAKLVENSKENPWQDRPVLDRWILGELYFLVQSVTTDLDNYDLTEASRKLGNFVGVLSQSYLRRIRDRIREEDLSAQQTLFECLVVLAQLVAPFCPFLAEVVWQRLYVPVYGEDVGSVHLSRWPEVKEDLVCETKTLRQAMKLVEKVEETVRSIRNENKLKIRQPLSKMLVEVNVSEAACILSFKKEILTEVNVEDLQVVSLVDLDLDPSLWRFRKEDHLVVGLCIEVTPELQEKGFVRETLRALGDLRKKIGCQVTDFVKVVFETSDPVLERILISSKEEILQRAKVILIAGNLQKKEYIVEVNGAKFAFDPEAGSSCVKE